MLKYETGRWGGQEGLMLIGDPIIRAKNQTNTI